MGVLGKILGYFVLIFIFSWIGEKLFYDFDQAVFLLFDGHIFKGLCTLFVMFILYSIAAIATCSNNNGGDSDSGKLAAFIIFAVLVYFVGSDVYELYQSSSSALDGTANAFLYLLVSANDVLKIITLFMALNF